MPRIPRPAAALLTAAIVFAAPAARAADGDAASGYGGADGGADTSGETTKRVGAPSGAAADADADAREDPSLWYTFSWPVGPGEGHRPRGGTSRGTEVTPAEEPSEAWQALQDAGLAKHERDRRAILALAGEYRTSFDFVETATYVPGKSRARPYQSWATELVLVLDEAPERIRLQHLLVMSYVEDGEVKGPFVQKHWRQDWRYEATERLEYRGEGRWSVVERPAETVDGTWTQTVYQVDDSPRYAATGRWRHQGGWSSWKTGRDWRPVPRRDHTVRDDYDVLAGEHRLTITPGGWTHAQANLKAKLAEPGALHPETPYVAREVGLNRYTRIRDYDFSKGRAYWEATHAFWSIVRTAWEKRLRPGSGFRIRSEVDGEPMFVPLFRYAEKIRQNKDLDASAARREVAAILDRYVVPLD